ncbi:MAG TPA: hypothetical protein VGL99_15795, partial [Chloroflexota bacterium]
RRRGRRNRVNAQPNQVRDEVLGLPSGRQPAPWVLGLPSGRQPAPWVLTTVTARDTHLEDEIASFLPAVLV